ncbi:MAG: type II toxin-antitoxin system RatA family toxin [Alphaproteobacteria bacterium]
MPRHEQRRPVPFTPAQMFDLVADIPRYAEFLPWCAGARITKREAAPDGNEVLHADLVIGYLAFRGTYTSRVALDRTGLKIDVTHTHGPFRHLINRWAFLPQPDGSCVIDFMIDFEFKNPIIRKLIELVFTEAVHRMVQAFETRAHAIYAPVSARDKIPQP